MNGELSPARCLVAMLAILGCGSANDGSRDTADKPQRHPVAAKAALASDSGLQCPDNRADELHRITFARADSLARALITRAGFGFDARRDCVAVVAETDSSVILTYWPPSAAGSKNDKRVLHYGGGTTVEVLASGRAIWRYATQ